MRDDMDKVIVERPRKGGGWSRPGRGERDVADEPTRQGMRRAQARTKYLNENLAPLKRWLQQQVHRPWDKVYAEISAGIDRRNTVQDHIHTHIGDFVEREARVIEGEVCVRYWRRGWVPITQTRTPLFVHPVSGILLPNRGLQGSAKRRAQARAALDGGTPFAKCHVVDASTQWHRVDGCWFEVKLECLPANPKEQRFDVLRRCLVGVSHAHQPPVHGVASNSAMYGRWNLYAAHKRQLSRREVARRVRSG